MPVSRSFRVVTAAPVRAFVFVAFAMLGLPGEAWAQQLKVVDQGGPRSVKAENSTSYIQVSATQNGGPVSFRCEPNSACSVAGMTNVSSSLYFDPTRERLVKCNNALQDMGPCSRADGLLSAELYLRNGRLKLTPTPAADSSGLMLDTTTGSPSVRFEFQESAADFWSAGYAKDLGGNPDFARMPAGTYLVFADALSRHCAPEHANAGVEVTVAEGADTELTLLFSATTCLVEVTRMEGSSGATGSVSSSPAGLTCGPLASDKCVARFAYRTALTLTPQPDPGNAYSWQSGAGCFPVDAPCAQTLSSDKSGYKVSFFAAPPGADAGMPADGGSDAGVPDGGELADAGSEVDAGMNADAGEEGDAGVMPDAGAGSGPNPVPSSPPNEGDPDEAVGCASAGGGAASFLLLLAASWLSRRRRAA